MARDRPSPYGNPGRFFTVARGPVPRDRCMAMGTRSDARMAPEGPNPTMTEPPHSIGQSARTTPVSQASLRRLLRVIIIVVLLRDACFAGNVRLGLRLRVSGVIVCCCVARSPFGIMF